MERIAYILSPVLSVLAVVVIGAGLGGAVTKRLQIEFTSHAEWFAVSAALGLGMLATIFFLCGLAGRFTLPFFGSILALSGCAALVLKRGPAGNAEKPDGHVVPIMLVLAPFVLPMLVLSFYPPLEWDSMHYHLPLIKAYLRVGQIAPVINLRFPVLAQLVEVLSAAPVAFSRDTAAQVMSVGFTALTCVTVYAFCRRHADPLTGLIAASLFASLPIVVWLGASADIDTGMAFFTTVALTSIINWNEHGRKGWLHAAALAAGFSAGAKITGLAVLGLMAVFTLVGRRGGLRASGVFVALALVTALPWYLYIAWHAHNPFWPLAQNFFGFWRWSHQDLSLQMDDFAKHGMGRGLKQLVLAPWNLAMHPRNFDAQIPNAQLAFLALYLIIPAGLFFRKNSWMRVAACFSVLGVAGWFGSSQVMRYVLPVVPLGFAVAAYAIRRTVGVIPRLERAAASPWSRALLLCVLLAPGTLAACQMLAPLGPVPGTNAERDRLERSIWPNVDAIQFLNERKGTNYTVYVIYGQNLNCLADGHTLGEMCGTFTFRRIYGLLGGPEKPLLKNLISMGADHLLVYVPELSYEKLLTWPEWTHLRPVFGSEQSALFQIVSEPVCRQETPDLLRDVDFNVTRKSGSPSWRPVPVRSGGLYELRLQVDDPGGSTRVDLRVTWFDAGMARVGSDGVWVHVDSQRTTSSIFLSAPDGAVKARVYVAVPRKGSVHVREIEFRPLIYTRCAAAGQAVAPPPARSSGSNSPPTADEPPST